MHVRGYTEALRKNGRSFHTEPDGGKIHALNNDLRAQWARKPNRKKTMLPLPPSKGHRKEEKRGKISLPP